MFWPSKMISPLVGSSSRFRQRRKVALARAGRTDDNDLFALLDMLVDALENLMVAIRLVQIFNVDHSSRSLLSKIPSSLVMMITPSR